MEHGESVPSLTPRNRMQVYNLKKQLVKEEEQHDDIHEVYLFAKQHPELVLKVDLIPQMLLVQSHPQMILHVQSLIRKFQLVLHYDTTFNVGPFFTSILSMRHPLFKNEPLIPIAVVFHETTNEEAHDVFFKYVCKVYDFNAENIIIVTDREKSITNAIQIHMGKATHLYCWNHLRQVGHLA